MDNHFVPRRRILTLFKKLCLSSKDSYHPPAVRTVIAPMVGFSEGSLVANLKKWARRSTRKERIVAKQSRPTSLEAEQSQRTSSVAQHLATTVEVEQSRRTSSVSQPLAPTAEAKQKIATAAETEQSHRTSSVAQHPAITPD